MKAMTNQGLETFIAEQRNIDANRTPGIWAKKEDDPNSASIISQIQSGAETVITVQVTGYEWDFAYVDIADNDAAFITAASANYGKLLDIIEAQQAEIKHLNEQIANDVEFNFGDHVVVTGASFDGNIALVGCKGVILEPVVVKDCM